MTFDLWISPEELSALPTRLATKTWFAGALTCDLQERHVTENNRSTNVKRTSEKAFGLIVFPSARRHNESFIVRRNSSRRNVYSVIPRCILRLPSSDGEQPVNTETRMFVRECEHTALHVSACTTE